MYGEYGANRHQTSSQDEDSGNLYSANSYPSFRSGKRSSRLGKGGTRLRLPDSKPHSVSENEELTNEDSNSHTGPSGTAMGWLRETPVKNETQVKNNNLSPPVAFKSINTIHRSTGIHMERSSVNNYIDSILQPMYNQFPDIVKPAKQPFTSECKRSLSFKSSEQKSSVLQDVMNLDNIGIHKTPGSKVGLHKHLDCGNIKTVDSAQDKENFIASLFHAPKIDNFFDKELQSVSHPLYSRKPSDKNMFIDLANELLPRNFDQPYYKDSDDFKSDCNNLPNKIHSVQSFNPFSKINHGPLVANTNATCLKETINSVNDHKIMESTPSILVSSYEDIQNIKASVNSAQNNLVQEKQSNNDVPIIQSNHLESQNSKIINHPNDNSKVVLNFEKPAIGQSYNNAPATDITPVYGANSIGNSLSSSNTVLLKPKNDSNSDSLDKKSNEKLVELHQSGKINSNLNGDKQELQCNKNNENLLQSSVNNESSKLPNSYASAVSMKPPASINVQSTSQQPRQQQQQKQLMAPPSRNTFMKPPQGLIKTSRSALLRTQSANNYNQMFNCGTKGVASNEKLFVNGRPYIVLSTLGKGGSSEVFLVLEPRSSKLVAVKCVNLLQVDRIIADGYLNEVELLLKLQGCESVIRMFDHEYVEDEKFLYVVMEKGDTDLSKLLRDISKTKNLSMTMIIYYWTEMLYAVKDIHDKGIIHSDLKPANFLLVCGRLKLIDFGIASSLQGDMTSVHKEVTTGTWNYMSPEAIRNNGNSAHGYKISYKSDVWSLGCILYNLVYGKTPFSHITSTWSKLMAIADQSHVIQFPDEIEGRGKIPTVILNTLKNCLTRDPKLRPSVSELLNYPYYQSSDVTNVDNVIQKTKDDLARDIRNILPVEHWLKIAHVFGEPQNVKTENPKD